MASTYLSKTFGSSGSLTTWTFSAWVKRGTLGADQRLLSCDDDVGTQDDLIKFLSGNTFQIGFYNAGFYGEKTTTRVFTDTNSFYHIVVVWDTTNGTADDRIRFYVNGIRETSFSSSTNPSLNANSVINSTSFPLEIGRRGFNNTQFFDGSMAHVHFCDGYAYDASYFGLTDTLTGIWMPKTAPSVSYGTNGFFLKMENSSNMDLDSSPNNHTFTTSGNLTQTLDTPSNVYANWNILTQSGATYSNGNLSVSGGDDMIATLGVTKGKYYWETKRTNASGSFHAGIACTESASGSATQFISGTNTSSSAIWIREDGAISGRDGQMSSMTHTDNFSSMSNGDIMAFALDLDSATKQITYYLNGSNVGNTTFSYNGTTPIFPFFRLNAGVTGTANFGNGYFGTTVISSPQSDANGNGLFAYAPPTGFLSLCTKSINAQEYA